MVAGLYGPHWIVPFSAVLTFFVLICSEIVPKTLGAHYWRTLGAPAAYLLQGMTLVMKPLIVPIRLLTRLLVPAESEDKVHKRDIINFIRIGYFQGIVHPGELEIMTNLFQLQATRVKSIMTPRTVVFHLPPDLTVGELVERETFLQFSRIPLYNMTEDRVEGVVLRRDIMDSAVRGETAPQLASIAMPPQFVPEGISVYTLLNQLIESKTHLAVVLDEYGGHSGVATLEDALETLLGREIVDEFDPAVDMRQVAREKGSRFMRDLPK